MHLIGFAFYVVACGTLAWLLAIVLTRRAREKWPRWVVAGVLAPIVFLLPLADEIVGNYQFERLCEEAKEAKIYGTIPVGEELYTPEGKWRLGFPGEDDRRLQKVLDSFLRQERGPAQEVHAAIPIRRYNAKIYDAKSGQLLAEWRWYGTSGGWLSQNLATSGNKILARQQCMPESFRQVEQSLLRFSKSSEVTK